MTAGGPGLNRRAFLARGVAAAVAAGFAPLGFGAESMPWRVSSGAQRVVVAGAGLAGLEAALELVEAGHVVTVFEARSRPGGRVRTLREPFADGLTAEAGAMSIPESHELTLDTARRFGLPLLDAVRPAPKTLAWMRGRRMVVPAGEEPPWPVELTPRERSLGAAGMNREYWGRELEIAAGHADSLDWPPAELAGLDRLSLADL